MVYKARQAIASSYAKRIRQIVEEELKNPGYLEKIKTFPHSREATNVTALLFTKVLLMGMNHALGKKKKGHKFADGVDEQTQTGQDVEVLPFEEAVEYMQGRLPLDAKEYYNLADKARFRAFTVSLLADGDLLVKTKNMLAKNLEEGGGLKDFLVKTDTDLLKGVGMAGAGGGWYWETVYRTNVQTAYNVGRAIGFETVPPVALELVGIGDARQTELCKRLTQPPVRRPYGDDFWKRFWPPLHFNCRTTVRAIYDEQELEEEPVTGIPVDAEKHKSQGWGSYPLDDNKWWEELPSMKKRAQAYGVQGMIDRARERLLEKTKNAAKELYPSEQWEEKAKGVYVAKARTPKNKQQKTIFNKEFEMAKIAADNGHVIYMLPETSNGKNPDVVMDGVLTEFKEITGGLKTVGKRFHEAMEQGKNIFLNITNDLSVQDIYKKIKGEIKFHGYKSGKVFIYLKNKMYLWSIGDIE